MILDPTRLNHWGVKKCEDWGWRWKGPAQPQA